MNENVIFTYYTINQLWARKIVLLLLLSCYKLISRTIAITTTIIDRDWI